MRRFFWAARESKFKVASTPRRLWRASTPRVPALSHPQVVESAPRIPADAICYICRNDASVQGLVSGCGCHGGDGIAHVSCVARMAQLTVADDGDAFKKWEMCYDCGQAYRGHAAAARAKIKFFRKLGMRRRGVSPAPRGPARRRRGTHRRDNSAE